MNDLLKRAQKITSKAISEANDPDSFFAEVADTTMRWIHEIETNITDSSEQRQYSEFYDALYKLYKESKLLGKKPTDYRR